ncbi:hypothetical protein ACFL44_02240 [Gemmatimonadota bacterium]
MSKSWTDKFRPIMVMGYLFILIAVYFMIDNFYGGWLIGICSMTGISFIIVDMEFKKLKSRPDKQETPSAPPATEEV